MCSADYLPKAFAVAIIAADGMLSITACGMLFAKSIALASASSFSFLSLSAFWAAVRLVNSTELKAVRSPAAVTVVGLE